MTEKKCCKNCGHFVQHYSREKTRVYLVHCGHCVYPRIKHRCPDDSCDKWTEKKSAAPVR